MIHPSFIPPRPIRELRDLTRRRKRLLGNATAEKNRVQKILEDANVKLGNVLSVRQKQRLITTPHPAAGQAGHRDSKPGPPLLQAQANPAV